MEVIGVGWTKTGTASLKEALTILGYPCYSIEDVVQRQHSSFWLAVADKEPRDFDEVFVQPDVKFAASVDFPVAQYWKELVDRYPDVKVILTERSPEEWYQALQQTVLRVLPESGRSSWWFRMAMRLGLPHKKFQELLQTMYFRDAFNGSISKENLTRRYLAHNEEVKATCPSSQLLVYDTSSEWGPLCKFLDKPVPNVPFPHRNDSQKFNEAVRRRAATMMWTKLFTYGSFLLPTLWLLLGDQWDKCHG